MAVIGNAPFQGLVSGGNILDASIEGVDLSTSAIAARLGYTPVDPGAAVFSANPTISSGVANGVAYLNGSKVVTSSSALTFDGGTNFSLTGTGLYPIIAVYPTGNNAIFGFRLDASAGNGIDWRVEQGRSAVGDFNIGAPTVNSTPQYVILKNLSAQYWSIGSSEQMRLTFTGLGIGTNSPASKLHIESASAESFRIGYSSTKTARLGTTSTGDLQVYAYDSAIGYKNILLAIDAGTSAGSVGIGTNSPAYKLQVASGDAQVAEFTSSAAATAVRINNTNAAGWGGNLAFYSNGTGAGFVGTVGSLIGSTAQDIAIWATAGNAFRVYTNGNNERMRITSAGDLGIGTSSPTQSFDTTGKIRIRDGGNSTIPSLQMGTSGVDGLSLPNTGTLAFITNSNERVRIDASGNVGMGTTSVSSGYRLDVRGNIMAYTATGNVGVVVASGTSANGAINAVAGTGLNLNTDATNRNITFSINSTEQARITSTGNFLVGKPNDDGGYKFDVYGDAHVGLGSENRGLYIGPIGYTASLRYNGNGNLDIAPRAGYSIAFLTETGGTERVRITNSGSIGIGTSAPGTDSKLDVVGNITIDSAFSSQYGICFRRGFETSDNLRIYAGDTGLGRTGGLRLTAYDGISFGTGSNTWQERVRITNAGHMIPAANDTYDLGGAGSAWRNIYTNDLHLNNESKLGGNDIDGTTGNWTIQEGADNLYIINNKTGKKYSFALKEVV